MASTPTSKVSFSLLVLFLLLATTTATLNVISQFTSTTPPYDRRETRIRGGDDDENNATHLQFYYHQIWSGPNATAFTVAGIQQNPFVLFQFGNIAVIDDPLTEGPELNSTLIGRGQGLAVWPSQEDQSVLVLFNLVFTAGEYNGSTLMVPGRVEATGDADRPIVGGSGQFHGARGYVLTKFVSAVGTTFTTVFDVYITRKCAVSCGQASNKYLQQE